MSRDPPSPVPLASPEARLVVLNDRGRVGLLARAERSLPAGMVLVQVKDLVGRRRAFRLVPRSLRATPVATEPALVLRGGLTSLVSYYAVPEDELDADELHFEDGVQTHRYETRLRVACHGRARVAMAA